jgi:hypothetical protein
MMQAELAAHNKRLPQSQWSIGSIRSSFRGSKAKPVENDNPDPGSVR